MKARVFKYELQMRDYTDLELPRFTEILSVHQQAGGVQLWAKVDADETLMIRRRVWMIGTGNPMPEHVTLRFINTVLFQDGALVFHFFEEVR